MTVDPVGWRRRFPSEIWPPLMNISLMDFELEQQSAEMVLPRTVIANSVRSARVILIVLSLSAKRETRKTYDAEVSITVVRASPQKRLV